MNNMIRIHIAWRLPWRTAPDAEITIPKGSRITGLPALLGEDACKERVLFVRNQRMCDETEELLPGDRLIILPIISGG